MFTSIESLRWTLFFRNIDARAWELHLRDPRSGGKQTKYVSHGGSFLQACQAGELEIMRAMVERKQVDVEARDECSGDAPLDWVAGKGHIPVVQYLKHHYTLQFVAHRVLYIVYGNPLIHYLI